MATIFYVRKVSQANSIASSREVSVEDIINLYGSEPANYLFMKGADSPTGITVEDRPNSFLILPMRLSKLTKPKLIRKHFQKMVFIL